MRRIPLSLSLVILVLLVVPAGASAAVPTMSLVDPITDNYKASYNADPTKPELRTWLAMQRIEVAGTTWQPVVPDRISVVAGGSVDVVAADGRQGRLQVQVASGPFGSPLWRVDPANVSSGGRWGILATVTDRQTFTTTPGVFRLTLLVGQEQFGAGVVEYRHDGVIANVPKGHIEYNGPGGRWYVGGTATRTQEEPPPATPPTLVAGAPVQAVVRPRVTGVTIPARTRVRSIRMRVRGRAALPTAKITHVRVRVGGSRAWGRWIRTRATYSIVLPRGRATHVISVQLRDARGVVSSVATRRVTCLCS